MGEKAHAKCPVNHRYLLSPFLVESQAPQRVELYDEYRTARLHTGSLDSIVNIPCPLEWSQGQPYPTLYKGEKWEIVRILNKRRTGRSYEYSMMEEYLAAEKRIRLASILITRMSASCSRFLF